MKSSRVYREFLSLSALTILFALVIWLCGGSCALAAGLMRPADGLTPALQIRSHHVNVSIEDGYAVTTVEQVFHNPHAKDLEAIYSFPVPERGAVGEFTVWIDGAPVTGEVLEKKQARQIYEEEKAAGHDAGLTEKDEYRTFDICVSPVRAGQDTRIRLVYLQPVFVDHGVGRYVYPLEEGGVDEHKLAFWTAEETVQEQFSFQLNLRSGYPVDALRVPGVPQAAIQRVDAGLWTASITPAANSPQNPVEQFPEAGATASAPQPASPNGVFQLNKDIIVYWRHAANLPGGVELVTHRPDPAKPGAFLLTLTPGDDLQPITQGRDWVFVLDISGSMDGKYATLADGVRRALKALRPDDRFRIILFNKNAAELTSGFTPVTEASITRYIRKVENTAPNGGTNLYAGLEMGLNGLDSDRTGAIVLVTDGVANVGETQQRSFLKLLKTKDVRLFTFIMGNSANRPLLQTLTKASDGFAVSVSNSDDIVGRLLQATSKVTHQALHGVKLKVLGVRVSDITPEHIGSLYRGEQLLIFGKYMNSGEAQVVLSGRVSGQEKTYSTRFTFPETSSANPEIERLWAYDKIQALLNERDAFGETAEIRQAATDLALEYGLVTDYTSMLVLSEAQFAARNIERRNAKRVAAEQAAQQQRAQTAPKSNRVDTAQPMFTGNRATHSGQGGGSFDLLTLLVLAPLSLLWIRRREK